MRDFPHRQRAPLYILLGRYRRSALPPEVCAESPSFDLGELFNPGLSGIRLGAHVK